MSRLSDEIHALLDEVEGKARQASDVRKRAMGQNPDPETGIPVTHFADVAHHDGPVNAILDHIATIRTHADNVHIKYPDEPTSVDINKGVTPAAAPAASDPAAATTEGA